VDFATGKEPGSVAATSFTGSGNTSQDVVTSNGLDATISVLLNTAATHVKLTSAPNPSTQGQTVTFTATVTASVAGSPAPTGNVLFQIASKKKSVALVNGTASLKTATLASGKYKVRSSYSGDANFNPNTSNVVVQTVDP
jgi:hypothetical protein